MVTNRLLIDECDRWDRSTLADPCIRRTLHAATRLAYDLGADPYTGEAYLVLGWDAIGVLSRAREIREYLATVTDGSWGIAELGLGEPDYPFWTRNGLPPRLYGLRLRFNEAQPFGTADLVLGNTLVVLEPIV